MYETAAVVLDPGVISLWEVKRLTGDVVTVSWIAHATHPTLTFETRTGQLLPLPVRGEGVTVVRVVDGKVFSADKHWRRGGDVFAPSEFTGRSTAG